MKAQFEKLKEKNPSRVLCLSNDYSDEETEAPELPPMNACPLAIVPIFGEMTKGSGLTEAECFEFGICDLDYVTEDLKEAAADPNVSQIFLWFRSPGGEVPGVQELADLVATVSQTKEVIGYTDTVCASAAYWVYSACSTCLSSDTSRVGNVGAYVERLDLTEQLKTNGVKINIVQDGDAKTYGHPATVMSKEEQSQIQTRVSLIADNFRQSILSHRQIDSALLQGQVFLGEQAVTNGFVDGIVPDAESVLTIMALKVLANS